MRAIAIILMVEIHFVENLSPRASPWKWLYDVSGVLGDLPAPMFTFLVGLSLWLWLRRDEAKGVEPARIRRRVMRRGLFIFLSGLAFAAAIWRPAGLFDWDILTLIGASTLILFPMRRLRPWVFVAVALLIVAAAPPLREMSGYARHWNDGEYEYAFTLRDVLLGFTLQGCFPLLPWLVFPLLGFATGKAFYGGKGARLSPAMPVLGMVVLSLSGLLLAAASRHGAALGAYAEGLSFYPASTPYALGMLGAILVALWLLDLWLDRGATPPSGPVFSFFRRYSGFAFTAYVVHHAVHIWPLYAFALWRGLPLEAYYENAMDTGSAFALFVLFTAVFYALLVRWERAGARYSFERMLRRFANS